MRKLVVYIAGPFRAKDKTHGYNYFEQHQNIMKAEKLSWNVWALGGVALCPHLNTVHFQGSLPDSVWLEGDLELLRHSDVVLMVDGWEKSSGALMEREVAVRLGIPVLYDLIELEAMIRSREVPRDVVSRTE